MASASSFLLRLHSYSTKTCLLIVDSSWAARNINTALLLHIINSQVVRGFSLNAVFCKILALCRISSRCMNHRNYLRLSYIFSSATVWKLKLESHLTWIKRSSEHSDVLIKNLWSIFVWVWLHVVSTFQFCVNIQGNLLYQNFYFEILAWDLHDFSFSGPGHFGKKHVANKYWL